MNEPIDVVLAVDPGRSKCGVAVVRRGAHGAHEVVHQAVIDTGSASTQLADLARAHSPKVVLVGNGTTSAAMVELAHGLAVAQVEIVDEEFTTLLARKRYFQANPPRGWRRLIPISMLTPSRPYDDYVAVILAERYFDAP